MRRRSRARSTTLRRSATPGARRAHRLERRVARTGDERGERRLAAAGRTPEDERRHLAGIDRPAQHGPGADRAVLADELVERPRPHPRRQRRVRSCRLGGSVAGSSGSAPKSELCPATGERSAQLWTADGDDGRRLEPGRVTEHAAQHLRRTEQPGRLRGHHQLGVGALGELRQRVQLEDRDQRRIRLRPP